MSTRTASICSKMDGRLALVIADYEAGRFRSIRAAAKAYEVPKSTFTDRLRGVQTRRVSQLSNRKLTETEENALIQWIVDLSERGHPVRILHIEHMANQLLSERVGPGSTVGKSWAQRFVTRNDQIRTIRYRKYDYERALCEDPEKIREWFDLVRNTINKYGITSADMWNFDETGFQMGVLGSATVVTKADSDRRQSYIQAGNREWVTTIEAINAEGQAIPPMIIFKGKMHQAAWYEPDRLDSTWTIGLSDSGWTNDQLGLQWLKNVFEPHTTKLRIGAFRLLIMDGHGSHATPEFDTLCKELNIVPLYMPPHSSHLLQPLDVGCFSPLKRAYTKHLENTFRVGINHIDKLEFLDTYKQARPEVFTKNNILSSFGASGLHPFDPIRVLDRINAPLRTRTPENDPQQISTHSSPWDPKTPQTTRELQRQTKILADRLRTRSRSLSSPTRIIVDQVFKACSTAMHGVTLLATENKALRAANAKQKHKRKALRVYIGQGDILTGEEAQDRAKRARIDLNQVVPGPSVPGESSSGRAARKCSMCSSILHNARTCPERS